MAANPVLIGVVALVSTGAGLGGFAVARAVGDDGGRADATVAMYACPDPGAPAIGAARPGDRVWVVGRTDDRWAVVRLPDDPTRTAWMPLDVVAVDGDAALLPEIGCPSPDDGAAASVPASTAPPSSAPASSSPPTTAPATTAPPTTAPSATVPDSTQPVTTPTTVTTVTTVTTSTTSTTSTVSSATTSVVATTTPSTTAAPTTVTTTTVPPDTAPPGAVVSPDRTSFHDVNGDPACVDLLFVTATPTDDRPGAVLIGVTARWTGQAGPAEVALAADAGRYRLEVFSNPPATSAIVTITASVRDAAGNTGVGTATVTLLNAGSNGCVVG